jgi:hypothetical protein
MSIAVNGTAKIEGDKARGKERVFSARKRQLGSFFMRREIEKSVAFREREREEDLRGGGSKINGE